ncbi:MAG: CHAT domain-containing protein [Pseudomonadota bacterium]
MNQYLFVDGGVVCRRFDSDPVSELGQPVVASEDGPQPVPALNALRDWKKRYALASVRNDENVLREIGTEMFDWLDTAGALSDWMKPAERHLQILPDDNSNPELATALMEAPWEILFNRGFLAADLAQLFVVSRRVMKPSETPWDPSHGDLRMMFMAAAPEGVSELDYEAEEVAIINATQSAAGSSSLAHLVVEESGALELLSERLDGRDGDFEVLHLSCHGDIIAPRGDDGTRHGAERPVLILEGVDGTPHEVSAPEMISTCQGTMPPLVFVSACRTAQRGGPDTLRGAADMRRTGMGEGVGLLNNPLHTRDIGKDQAAPIAEAAEPYVLELVRGVGNVLGWDGSVYDHDASAFATGFYRALSRGRNVPTAAAVARRDLIQERQRDPKNGRHWHLARVYLGAEGGGPICKPGLKGRDVPATVPEFLDSENKIRVAGRETFVGRRRTIQKALTTLRSGDRGLLTHGIGNLGKSSLAKRIADRLISYQTVVVVSPRADLGSANGRVIFEKLKAAMGKRADALEYGSPQAEELRNQAAAMEADLAEAPERFCVRYWPARSRTSPFFWSWTTLRILWRRQRLRRRSRNRKRIYCGIYRRSFVRLPGLASRQGSW